MTSLPPLFVICGPLSDPDFDIVEDYYPTPDIIEVVNGPKYLLVCTATQDKVQVIDFVEDTGGEIRIAKKSLHYEPVPAQIKLKHNRHGKVETIKFQKTNMFLSRETTTKGYTMVPIYKLLSKREIWYFPIDKLLKRTLSFNETQELNQGM